MTDQFPLNIYIVYQVSALYDPANTKIREQRASIVLSESGRSHSDKLLLNMPPGLSYD